MIPDSYKPPQGGTWPDVERRRAAMSDPGSSTKSVERELGELVGAVKALADKVDDKARVEEGHYKELTLEIEKLGRQFSEYKTAHDTQSEKDYTYLDQKIDGVNGRVKKLEDIELTRVVSSAAQKDNPWVKFQNKLLDGVYTAIVVLLVGAGGWVLIQFINSGGTP